MFMQIIQGRVRDTEAAKAALDRWQTDLAPGAEGWLGGTYGVTDDGMMVAAVRFESRDAAQRNSERPEQSSWWSEMESCFDGEVTFHDCDDVTLLAGGGSDKAGFVQVIQGRITDRERARSIIEQSAKMISQYRPDVLGATLAVDKDGFFTETVAFTSEDEARKNETKELPEEARKMFEEEMSLMQDVKYLDLHQPWFSSRH
ncbi:hypothetical protein [Actinokineospora xionganensis]|uniref:Antibiotic biosynthesis monooxygenase n=1 Tax=Actinokineospora xionganensis TaxID=2684470 RepID=A0ABR7LG37_9PSEU|nr:hypothetical protein [Actinokineospora xionganensis]MBC6451679.1 hypothetical protein [Actinokineospora xionganensis]